MKNTYYKETLVNLGIKEDVVDKLSIDLQKELISFVENFSFQDPHMIFRHVAMLVRMEIKGKNGSVKLAQSGIASIDQIKVLSKDDIDQILDELKSDESGAKALLLNIITEYQEKKKTSALAKHGILS